MCQKYTFYHICGHIDKTTTLKCTKAIQSQLNITRDDDESAQASDASSPTSAEQMSPIAHTFSVASCDTLSCKELIANPQIKLRPTLCSACEQIEAISSWLNDNRALRYDMMKEWSRNKTNVEKDGHSS